MTPTHTVLNQPPPLEPYNPYLSDPVLDAAVASEGGKSSRDRLVALGERVGSMEVNEWGVLANLHAPVLRTHDRHGHRIDQVEFHPAWHALLDLAIGNGLHSLPWEPHPPEAPQVVRAAALYLTTQAEAGHTCPVSMTAAAIPALRTTPEISGDWEPRLTGRVYDPRFQPAPLKDGCLLGMGMTEKQGGSDVRANTTTAEPLGPSGPANPYLITGHKWFTSAPMCDAFLVLAQAPGGLSCFLLPRWTPEGAVNAFHLQRLKDKLGNRSNASSEVEFDGAWAQMIGEEGRGIQTIIEMVNGTRLDCVIGSAALMRQAVAQAGWHVAHRNAFGSRLIDKPLMQNVIADLDVETEAATSMMIRLAGAFDRSGTDPGEAAFRRLATPIAKYWVTKRCTEVVHEALECLGGNGYVEESNMPRLFRESPLNAIWEGSGNVIALDVVRAINREPDGASSFLEELHRSSGSDPRLSEAVTGARRAIDAVTNPEAEARRLVEMLATAWAGCLLAASGPPEVAEAYISSRIAGDHGSLYGTLPPSLPLARIARRGIPE